MLETERLWLRPFRAEDAADVQRLAGDPRIAATTTLPHPYEAGMAERWIACHEAWFRESVEVIFAICLKPLPGAGTDPSRSRQHSRLVGSIGLRLDSQQRTAELGYWVGVEYWNRGIATEAASALLGYARANSWRRVIAHHFLGNNASGAVLRKVGLRREGVVRGHVLPNGQQRDVVLYGREFS